MRTRDRSWAAVAAWVCLCLVPVHALAHERSTSHSTWTLVDDDAHVVLTVAARDVAAGMLGVDPSRGDGSALREALVRALVVAVPSGACIVDRTTFRALAARTGHLAWEWRARCPGGSDSLTLESHLFEREAPHHLHVARIRAGGVAVELILSGAERVATAQLSRPEPIGVWRALRLGVEHLALGFDHLAFLLTLIVVANTLRALVVTVTGFTLGHSVTLALGALGWVHPQVALVEALIGLSIVVVAVESVWLPQARRRVALPVSVVAGLVALAMIAASASVTRALLGTALFVGAYYALAVRTQRLARLHAGLAALFGLIHGLGFAGALSERPLTPEQFVPTLFGFNLGIELAQLAIAAMVWVALATLRRRSPQTARVLLELASATACGMGVYWTITRLA